MLQCPQCTKPLRELARRCPSCQADLELLVDYVGNLQGGIERAEGLTRAGELGEAVWAYLAVLEVDPDNAAARRQVGQVATAVRQFDHVTPGRRWVNNLPQLPGSKPWLPVWARWLLVAMAVLIGFGAGFLFGRYPIEWSNTNDDAPKPEFKPLDNSLGGHKA
jgi:hypothetical protein